MILTMSTAYRQKAVSLGNFWPFLWGEAQAQGLNKGRWFLASGVPLQRFSEFDRGSRTLSHQYFIKLIRGLGMTQETIEDKSGIKYTPDQKAEISLAGWIAAEKDALKVIKDKPREWKAFKDMLGIK